MRVYIAGPMTGYPDSNYPAFHEAAEKWRAQPHTDVLCPAENFGGRADLGNYQWYMRMDLTLLSIADAVALLPGWQRSKGALLEAHVALTLGLDLYDAVTFEKMDLTLGELAGWMLETFVLIPAGIAEEAIA